MTTATTLLHLTEVDGVRCFWVDTARPTLSSVLLMRSGMADEPLHESGWLHMLEHLALHDREHGTLAVNGRVDLTTTAFQAHGPPELVARHLGEISSWMATPCFDELDRERQVLRAEADVRGQGPVTRALSWRYGARGPGVSGFREAGLGRADADLLAARARRVFTQGNAVLVLDGPPPPDLRLHLPPGPAVAWTTAAPCDDALPARYVEESGLVLSGLVPRTVAASAAVEILRKILADRFREHDGSAYAPWSTYEAVDAETAVLLGGTDVRPDARARLADTAFDVVDRLRSNPPSSAQVEQLQATVVQTLLDPYQRAGIAMRAANDAQRGRSPRTLDELVDEARSVTEHEVFAVLEAFGSQLLLGLPSTTTWRNQVPWLESRVHAPQLSGRTWRSINWPADPSRLVVSDDAVELRSRKVARSIRLGQVAGMFVYADGVCELIGADGYGLAVDSRAWRQPTSVRSALDAAVPPDLHLPMPGGQQSAPTRLSPVRRLTAVLDPSVSGRRGHSDTWAYVALFVLLAAIAIVLAATGAGLNAPLLGFTGVVGLRLVFRLLR